MNKADSERIAGFLNNHGLHKAESRETAEFIILTTCGIRQSAEDRLYGLVHGIRKNQPKVKIIITGCLSGRKDVLVRLKGKADLFLPIGEISLLKKWIKQKSWPDSRKKTELIPSNNASDNKYLKIKPVYESSFQAFIPIGNGCDNFCSYCVVPYARDREIYRSAKEIVAEAEGLVKAGYKELALIAQNVNSYYDDKLKIKNYKLQRSNSKYSHPKNGIGFPALLELINAIPGNFWIRFATSHPKDMSDELISAISRCEKVCRHIHLPAQSGDDAILKKMNRKYTASHFTALADRIRKALNGDEKNGNTALWKTPVSLSTDVITGFPGETRAQFNNTKKLFKKCAFDLAYISQYSPRPGTVAAKMTDSVPRAEKKKREEELMAMLRKTALANNKKYLGRTIEVLVEEKIRSGQWFGKTETYKVIKFSASEPTDLTGQFVYVKITKAHDFGLDGIITS
jgi:tRNA-2-methylthio-N6-dimethylallyladenosine synthase